MSLIAYVISLEETGFMLYKFSLDDTSDFGGQSKVNTNYYSTTWVAKHDSKVKKKKKHQHMRRWGWKK